MPVHDWTRVDAGIFHDFHQRWIGAIRDVLNEQLLPEDYYALAEQVTEGPIPDVVTLERIEPFDDRTRTAQTPRNESVDSRPTIAVADYPPRVRHCLRGEQDVYASKSTRVGIRHVSGDRVVGYIEIVSPGNKHSELAVRRFLVKLQDAMRQGIHLLVVDIHPPTPRDPRGLHARFWNEAFGTGESPGVTKDQPYGLAAYLADGVPVAYFEPVGPADTLIDMPAFLTPDEYVNIPLEKTYQEAWRGVPNRWKTVIES